MMPVTFACFFVAAASISGVPPFNGFFSKEMVYSGALERGTIFYLAAIIGSFFTAASFLKLGHAIFFGKTVSEQGEIKEAHWSMVTPMILLAVSTIFFGVYQNFPFHYLIQPALGENFNIHYVFNFNQLVLFTLFILLTAVIDHAIGVRLSGSSIGCSDHFRNAPVLKNIYDLAEQQIFDPYVQGKKAGRYAAWGLYWVDRGINWIYQDLVPTVAGFISEARRFHNGHFANYLAWSMGGFLCLLIYFVCFFK